MIRALSLVAALCAGCDTVAESASNAAMSSPLSGLDRTIDRAPFDGVVVEAIDAGGYAYLRLDDGRWVTGLSKGARAGDRVRVEPVGTAADFRSRRLERTFDTVWFAAVTVQSKDQP